MAVNTNAFYVVNPDPAKRQVGGSPASPPTFLWGEGTPDGDRHPFTAAGKGSLYFESNATDDYSNVWVKVDDASDDNDWVLLKPETNAPITASASTLTVTKALHNGKTILLDRAAGVTVTLPAATGSGDKYRFYTKTTVTSNNNVIQVVGNDVMKGTAWMANDTDATVSAFETASDSDTITMNGSTKGGIIGDVIVLEDVVADTWSVQCFLQGTGLEATPFSAAV